ncbi:NAD(P)H-dependent oxidoreductase [Flavobacterium subsaxonicum]|uniref:Nitroreductase n=1 Tax=Flavobacterium subsaxonicum WB 4.1-42 = DSM 21790 TaxID=1121898 RepID=A0A0A2MH95_9FLAO|nr:NAD(P)H-dependent oxidoreductase [Flavobacterium subsaxonicum]KGO91644.1 nitroreductase [Flavobacterium subsaxonicum WB 4.1-42 = DSM 21790]
MLNYIDSLKWRYAAKKYDTTKKVSAEDLETLKEAVRLSVSSVGLQPYKIFIVETQAVKQQLAEAAGGNNKNIFVDASHLFIFANELNVGGTHVNAFLNNISNQRGVAIEAVSGFGDYINGFLATLTDEQKNVWTAKQAYIALSTLINSAALLKIDATPMEGFDAAKVNDILGLEAKGLNAAVIAAIGYRHEEDAQQHAKKVRKPNEELFITL